MPTKHSKRKSKDHTGKSQSHSTHGGSKGSHDADNFDEEMKGSENQSQEEISNHEQAHSAKSESDDQKDHDESSQTENDTENNEVKFDFPYSELVRAYVPKAMDVAEKVATDWKKDGSFMNLGIENAYANMAVSLGLQKAKELEKKLDEKGVLSAVRMGVEVIKQQVNKKK